VSKLYMQPTCYCDLHPPLLVATVLMAFLGINLPNSIPSPADYVK